MEKTKFPIPQKLLIFILFLCLGGGVVANSAKAAEKTSPPAKNSKSSLNTQVFESQDELSSFADQVKLVREMAGEFQVFFKTHPGVFRLSEGSPLQNLFLKAQKKSLEVNVKFQTESRMITEASIVEKP
jgi:hypothetical protein